MEQPLKSAWPLDVGIGFAVQVRVAFSPFDAGSIASATSPLTGLLPASLRLTTGWVPNALPPWASSGCVLKLTVDTPPALTDSAELTAVRALLPDAVAVNV